MSMHVHTRMRTSTHVPSLRWAVGHVWTAEVSWVSSVLGSGTPEDPLGAGANALLHTVTALPLCLPSVWLVNVPLTHGGWRGKLGSCRKGPRGLLPPTGSRAEVIGREEGVRGRGVATASGGDWDQMGRGGDRSG